MDDVLRTATVFEQVVVEQYGPWFLHASQHKVIECLSERLID